MKIFVYHTPELTPTDHLPDFAVVIDVLRATTTIATALNSGAQAVQVFSDTDKLKQESEAYSPEKRLLLGERGGKTMEGYDLGNSPLDCTKEVVEGKRLFLTTTNGTRALTTVQNANIVLTAALINYQSVVNYILQKQPETLWLVGSGWEGGYSLEDTVCAGAICESLLKTNVEIGNDEVIASQALYLQWQNNLLGMFHLCSHGKRLLGLNGQIDLEYCAQTNILDIVPIQKELSVLVKN